MMRDLTEAEKRYLGALSEGVNRSTRQMYLLYEMCDYDFVKLLTVEEKIKNNFLGYCPGDKEEVAKILAMGDRSFSWKINIITSTGYWK